MDERFHFPPDVFNLLVDTIPLLCKGKDDVLLFLRGAGVPKEDLAAMTAKVRADRNSVSKFSIVRDVLEKLNKRGDSALAARRVSPAPPCPPRSLVQHGTSRGKTPRSVCDRSASRPNSWPVRWRAACRAPSPDRRRG